MARFGRKSKRLLGECHPDLIKLFNVVVKEFDCSILEGKRSLDRQKELLADKKTKTLKSKHIEGKAVDVAPYPIDFEDRDRFHYFGGYVLGIAKMLNIDVIWGGDWNNNKETKDNSFDDLVHFELR